MSKKINILAIETSCDDTCCAIISNDIIASNVIKSQKIHAEFGGVVPELASRNHLENIATVVTEALTQANIKKEELSAISFTYGPGLKGPLLVGSIFAKSLSIGLKLPIIAVNHMHGHILANFIDEPFPNFPFLCLVVSGGHTQIVKVDSFENFKILGETLDDAIGEAYDKIGKTLGFEYPAGPKIDYYAQFGDKNKFKFPKTNIKEYNFSFSGIKTSVKYFLQDKSAEFIKSNINDLCASIQECLLNMLLDKFKKAIIDTEIKDIAVGGGVGCNNGLKERLKKLSQEMNLKLSIPQKQYCTDNAAMIAKIGYYKFLKGEFSDINIDINPDLKY